MKSISVLLGVALAVTLATTANGQSYYSSYGSYSGSYPAAASAAESSYTQTRTRDVRMNRRTSGTSYHRQEVSGSGCVSGVSCGSQASYHDSQGQSFDTFPGSLQHHVDISDRLDTGADLLALESAADLANKGGQQVVQQQQIVSSSSSGAKAQQSSSRRRVSSSRATSGTSRSGYASQASISSVSSSAYPARVAMSSSSSSYSSASGSLLGAAANTGAERHEDASVLLTRLSQQASIAAWWEGSNVCISREEQDESTLRTTTVRVEETTYSSGQPMMSMRSSTCQDSNGRYVCTNQISGPGVRKTITTTYECCHGYSLSGTTCVRGRSDTLFSTLEAVGSVEFKRLIQSAGLSRRLESDTLTLFIPSDLALRTYITQNGIRTTALSVQEMSQRRNTVIQRTVTTQSGSRRRCTYSRGTCTSHVEQDIDYDDMGDWKTGVRQEYEVTGTHTGRGDISIGADVRESILSHIVPGRVVTTEVTTEERTIYTESQHSTMRLESFVVGRERINTVNCARLISTNHECTNGVIHIVDRVLRPVTLTVEEILTRDTTLSLFRSWMHTSGLLDQFRDTRRRYTIFVPTDGAIRALGDDFIAKMSIRSPCVSRTIQHHIVPHTFCSSVVMSQGELTNMNQVLLKITRNSEDRLFIDGREIVTRDIVGTNGVIHVIDRVLMDETEEPLTFALEKAGLTSFASAIQRARISLSDYSNVTIFAPTNTAFQSLSQEILRDEYRLREVLLYHIATSNVKACHFTHQQQITTQLGSTNTIRINLYANLPVQKESEVTAQCGRITSINVQACNGIIHTVDRVLLPSQLDVVQVLRTQSDFSIFNRLISEYGLIDTLRSSGPYTIFAPKDSAFYALPRDVFDQILTYREDAVRIIKAHVVADSLCCSGILPSVWFLGKRVQTLGGTPVPLSRDAQGQVVFGSSVVTSCDLTAANGIIHTVDTVYTVDIRRTEYTTYTVMKQCVPIRGNLESTDVRTLFYRA